MSKKIQLKLLVSPDGKNYYEDKEFTEKYGGVIDLGVKNTNGILIESGISEQSFKLFISNVK